MSEEKKEKKDVDLTKYEVDSVVNVIPLEPAVVWVALSNKEDEEEGYKSIGIPGFYDSSSKKFMTLDGGRVKIDGFNEKLEEFVNQINQGSQPQGVANIQDNQQG